MKKIILKLLILEFIIFTGGISVAEAMTLSYTPVTPCRIVDTRKAGGAIPPGGIRSYNVRGAVVSQGGNPAGCSSPKGEPRAVHINVTSVPLGNGWITAYPYGLTAPTASIVNYRSDAQNVANSGTVKTCFNCAKDINIKSGGGTTHVIIDVLGYYYPDLEYGLEAYYPFNGNANDESGNGNHGTVYGATLTTDRFGNANSAYSFDGLYDLIEVSDNPLFHFSTQMTIAAWVKPLDIFKLQTIVNKWYSLDSYGLFISNGFITFSIAFPDGPWGHAEDVSAPLVLNDWVHVAGVFDGRGIFLYLNCDLEASEAAEGVLQDSNRPISIGNHPFWNAFEGIIDEIRLYNRALSVAGIKALCNLGN